MQVSGCNVLSTLSQVTDRADGNWLSNSIFLLRTAQFGKVAAAAPALVRYSSTKTALGFS